MISRTTLKQPKESKTGNWTVVVQGTGPHHNFKQLDANKLIPDGEGDYERNCNDADLLAAKFVRHLKVTGQTVTSATFTSGSTDDINRDRHMLKAEV
jgi:hypothetical protein